MRWGVWFHGPFSDLFLLALAVKRGGRFATFAPCINAALVPSG
jgi:hypothetical protein